MRALLLAAGLGSRLRPLTNHTPKCLLPIKDKPLLEYWLENLSAVGVDEFLINSSYLHEQVEAFVQKSRFKEQINLTYEPQLLNTAGTLLANKTFFEEESFMLVHADNLCFCDFSQFIDSHKNRDKKCVMTMMLFESDTPSSCGIVELDSNNIVQKFHEKVPNPPSNLANGAVYICEPSIFEFLEKENLDFSLDVIPHYLGKINTYRNTTYHRDIGTPQSYALAEKEVGAYIKLG